MVFNFSSCDMPWIRAKTAPVILANGEIVASVIAVQYVGDAEREKQALVDRIASLEGLLAGIDSKLKVPAVDDQL